MIARPDPSVPAAFPTVYSRTGRIESAFSEGVAQEGETVVSWILRVLLFCHRSPFFLLFVLNNGKDVDQVLGTAEYVLC